MQLKVQIKTLASHHIEEFIQCPYKFYQRQLRDRKQQLADWRDFVGVTVHKVVKEYYLKAPYERSSYLILKLIEKYWSKLSPDLFQSQIHYYEVLASVSDYLLAFLMSEWQDDTPLFVYEKYGVYVPELETNISLLIDAAYWSGSSYEVTKFLLDDQLEVKEMMTAFIVVFTKHAFNRVPKAIHFYSLLTGRRETVHIEPEDYSQSIRKLKMMKDILEEPKFFQKTASIEECRNCPLRFECSTGSDIQAEKLTMLI
ncbi:hypothetical protein CHN50_13065 [Priestia aryabhattai]|uniref:PD-(D/E)XK nuclease family protein n=1 Tax=Priestia TaxID=2800373 RepID=UPI000BA02D69|nr:PD-(D/E)XK nuclease family protein [Priestia flexa]MDT2045107.1 PD-(D/E)XK nuclease family protein [Priestia flexa]OZT12312.1 hypothetical protein CHN50_13065 [Priestia aryabhattai]USY54808.1 PD-(D/E)XK nuclease family protein [Bacillus sp. 1780r2a1]